MIRFLFLQVCKRLSHTAKFRAGLLNAGRARRLKKDDLARPIDVLVATPFGLLENISEGNVYIGECRFFVLDEADTMFDRGFGPEVKQVLEPMKKKARPANTVLVSATMTKKVQRVIQESLPDAKRIATDSLHKGVAGSVHEFLTVPPGGDKLRMTLDILEGRGVAGAARGAAGGRVMVFCNTQDSCRAVELFLKEEGVPTVCYHGDMPRESRKEVTPSGRTGIPSPIAGPVDDFRFFSAFT